MAQLLADALMKNLYIAAMIIHEKHEQGDWFQRGLHYKWREEMHYVSKIMEYRDS